MTTPRIVLFGATGYTGRLTAKALVALGAEPLLAGRDPARLADLASSLPGTLPTAVADATRPRSVARLLRPGDVLVSTVGPFLRWGDAAVMAAIEAGAVYLDSTGEPPFVKRVFQRHGPEAAAAGATLIPAFGYDYVPGNLAAALALRKAGNDAIRVDVGYFLRGNVAKRASAGTRASALSMILEPMYGFRDGRIVRETGRTRAFAFGTRRRHGIAMGASEHFALPRTHPRLREVNVYLGWLGGLTRAAGVFARATPVLRALPGSKRLLAAMAERAARSANQEAPPIASQTIAEAYADDGTLLATVRLNGGDPYDLTARMLAWGATSALVGGVGGIGALGPAEAFGLDALADGCASAGLTP